MKDFENLPCEQIRRDNAGYQPEPLQLTNEQMHDKKNNAIRVDIEYDFSKQNLSVIVSFKHLIKKIFNPLE